MFSMYPSDTPFPVIENDLWWGDSWDAINFGRKIDFSRSFFKQFIELRNTVPHWALAVKNMENSQYCNSAVGLKNCYLVFNAVDAQDCMYCSGSSKSRDCLDCETAVSSELCYDCTYCFFCYNLQSSQFCENCGDSFFLSSCIGCHHCVGCINLHHRQYCVFNEQYGEADYHKFLSGIDLSSYQGRRALQEKAKQFFSGHPRRHRMTRLVEDVSGNYLTECKNVKESYLIRKGENISYSFGFSENARDCHDCTSGGVSAERCYECVMCGVGALNLRFCYECVENNRDLLYCALCSGCKDCFGCVGLRNKQYCILNRQYEKSDYERLAAKLAQHMCNSAEWGEFFPLAASPFHYNLCLAFRHFPLSKEQAVALGLKWHSGEELFAKDACDADSLPDGLPASDSAIIVKSAESSRPFRITSEELRRYRTFKVPLPRITFEERSMQRSGIIGAITLFERPCAHSGKMLRTTIKPDDPAPVWEEEIFCKTFYS